MTIRAAKLHAKELVEREQTEARYQQGGMLVSWREGYSESASQGRLGLKHVASWEYTSTQQEHIASLLFKSKLHARTQKDKLRRASSPVCSIPDMVTLDKSPFSAVSSGY